MWQLSVSVFYDIILLGSLCALSRHLKYVQIIQLLLFGCFIKKSVYFQILVPKHFPLVALGIQFMFLLHCKNVSKKGLLFCAR